MTESQRQALEDYRLKPVILSAAEAIENKLIVFSEDGSARLNLADQTVSMSLSEQFDMVLPTIFGLNEALVQAEEGQELRRSFEDEFAKFNQLYDLHGDVRRYGHYVYYPDRQHLVQFAPQFWHKLSLLASNAELVSGPTKKTWSEARKIFSNSKPVIAGASVGSKIADAVLKVLRPDEMTIADPAVYKLTNANRTDISYDDIVYSAGLQNKLSEIGEFVPYGMKNKAVSFSLRAQRIDPFVTMFPFQKGITMGNVEDFVAGGDIIIEEVDMSYDMEIKVAIRAEARKQKKLFCMITDLGSWVQWDIRPFNLNSDIPLFLNCSDEKIYSLNKEARESKEMFFSFLEGLIDRHFWDSGEFGATLGGQLPRIVGSMPQLGSTTSVAAGVGAEFIARMLLGHLDLFERGIIDLRKQEIRTYGKMIGDL
ncbi:MAG: hypothetical protein K2P92_02765 [Bdellovibrionaceae bacterium]|nr:hypothetical protein [Pseudobdellovibrionaceae bacterium]